MARSARGPIPRYCGHSCRQRAYEQRRRTGASQHLITALRETSVRADADDDVYWRLATATQAFLTAHAIVFTPVTRPAPRRARPAAGPAPPDTRGRRAKPWLVLLHAGEPGDLAAAEVITAHTTERGADQARHRYEAVWRRRQSPRVCARWQWTTREVPGVDPVAAGALSVDEALAVAACPIVPVAPPHDSVVYRRSPEPGFPVFIRLQRVKGQAEEPLAPAYHRAHYRRTEDDEHPYAGDLLVDACDTSVDGSGKVPGLRDYGAAFRSEMLDPLPESWELTAAAIREWLVGRGALRVVPQ